MRISLLLFLCSLLLVLATSACRSPDQDRPGQSNDVAMLGVVGLIEDVPRILDLGDGESCVVRGKLLGDQKIHIIAETERPVTAEDGLDDVPVGSPLTTVKEFSVEPGRKVMMFVSSKEGQFTSEIVTELSPDSN